MDVSTIALLVCILFILFLLFLLHKQRKTILRHKHIIAIHEEKIDTQDSQIATEKKKTTELENKLLSYQLKDFDEITSEYMQKIMRSPWKSFKTAAEQLNEYYSKVPEFYFEHKAYQRNRVFDGWAQELRRCIENTKNVADLTKIFEGFSEEPASIHVKLMQRIREATPVFQRGFVIFEIWSRSEFARSLVEKNLEPLKKSNCLEKERQEIEKMLNLQCLEGFFDSNVREKFNEVCKRSV